MVNLSKDQKQYIQEKCSHPAEVIYVIEKRIKHLNEKMTLEEIIDWAELYLEEQSFHKGDFNNNDDAS